MEIFLFPHCTRENIHMAKIFAKDWKDKICDIAKIDMKEKKDADKVIEELNQLATWARGNAEGFMRLIKGEFGRELRSQGFP